VSADTATIQPEPRADQDVYTVTLQKEGGEKAISKTYVTKNLIADPTFDLVGYVLNEARISITVLIEREGDDRLR
jgi:hypothetical protein